MSATSANTVAGHRTRSTLLLAGSFAFAFLLGEAVHELGHYLAHRAYGTPDIGIHLDPFGGSHIVGVKSLPLEVMGVTSLAGPLLNLVLGILAFLVLWRWRRPLLLPLLAWGPVAMVQEGVTLSLGLLTPGGDAGWIVAWGAPQALVLLAGLVSLAAGVFTLSWLFPVAALGKEQSFGARFEVLTVGISLLMVVRAIHSLATSPAAATEDLVPLVFSLLLAALAVALHRPAVSLLGRMSEPRLHAVTWPAVAAALMLGTAMFVFQIVALS
jgi:hypothetical protein